MNTGKTQLASAKAHAVPAAVRRVGGSAGTLSMHGGARGPRPSAPNINILRMVHQGLRGRYAIAIGLALITGGLFAFAGWRLGRPMYHSESLVRVAYSLPQVFERTDQNEPMGQMFDTFMQSQRLLISSRRVIDMALEDPVWRASGLQPPSNPDEYFADSLDVTVRPRSEYISIAVRDADPGAAAAAATAIANAYAELYHSQEKQLEHQRTGVLEERQTFLDNRLQQLNTQIRGIATKFGTTALDALHDAAMLRVNRFETALADLRIAMMSMAPLPSATTAAASDGADESTEPGTPPQTPEQIAATDPVMRSYLTDEETLDRELSRLQAVGYGTSHPQIVATSRALEDARARVRRYAELPPAARLAPMPQGGLGDPRSAAMVVTAGKSEEQLQQDVANLREMQKEAKAELAAIGLDRFNLKQLEAELTAVRVELDQVTRRITGLRAEAALGGRLNIISTGEIPLSPDRDPRLRMAAAAGLAGAGLPVGLLVLLPFVRPRYRYHDEAESDVPSSVPLLGILPSLKRYEPGSDETASAVHSLHQMRVTLLAQAPREGCCSYLITSATSGEGKTSVAMSLGLSFAACHARTLVIDGDLVGRQLTRSLRATDVRGLTEAVAEGSLRGLVRKSAGGVYVLCAGKSGASDACGLSAPAVSALLAEARQHFDVVLIDSGPIMGSVEAAVFAPEVDGVVFAIGRGQQKGLVQKAHKRLDSLGARIAGVVFNRAQLRDYRRSPFGSSANSSSTSFSAGDGTTCVSQAQRFAGFGPLVQAVASELPTGSN